MRKKKTQHEKLLEENRKLRSKLKDVRQAKIMLEQTIKSLEAENSDLLERVDAAERKINSGRIVWPV